MGSIMRAIKILKVIWRFPMSWRVIFIYRLHWRGDYLTCTIFYTILKPWRNIWRKWNFLPLGYWYYWIYIEGNNTQRRKYITIISGQRNYVQRGLCKKRWGWSRGRKKATPHIFSFWKLVLIKEVIWLCYVCWQWIYWFDENQYEGVL